MLGNIEIKGDFDKALITLLSLVADNKSTMRESLLFRTADVVKRKIFTETRDKALRDIQSHYDLSNEFYQQFLDPTLTYSCAYFKIENDSLEKAQLQKYEHICRKLFLKKGERLVDVGCGWGGMLIYAAQKYGAVGYGVTLSENQFEYASHLIKKLGLERQIRVELKDYRDIKGQFDKFVSIGMFEHVTEKYYDQFFAKVHEILVPKGIGVLQSIGVNGPKSAEIDPWYNTYIFPGGQLPSAPDMLKYSSKNGLVAVDLENLRLHYAKTLKFWAENYLKVYDQTIEERGEKFARMWKWYLYLSRATFITGISHLFQLTFTNGINNDYPMTRYHLYSKS